MLGRVEVLSGKGDAGRFLGIWDLVDDGVVVWVGERGGFGWFSVSVSVVDLGWVLHWGMLLLDGGVWR